MELDSPNSEVDSPLLPVLTAGSPGAVFVAVLRTTFERASCGIHELWGPHLLNIYCSSGCG